MTAPSVLAESWFPFAPVGAESQREKGYGTPFPATTRIHVWWARRPLTTSRAAVLAGLLPEWSQDWPEGLHEHFRSAEAYRSWFVQLLGIRGDPVAGRKLQEWASAKNVTLKGGPYGGAPRAFSVNPEQADLAIMLDLLEYTWGTREITVMDPMAGGGSIPFEALRYGFTTIANELNPVASVVLKATLDYPARFGPELAEDIRHWGTVWAERVEEKLADFFPRQPGESIFAYLWARTVACPTTGKPVPLSPNWWLSSGDNKAAVRLLTDPAWSEPRFEIVRGKQIDFDPDEGTISRGVARSPWNGDTIDGDYIKREAHAGRMGQMLYAVAVKRTGGFDFRAPTDEDRSAGKRAEAVLAANLQRWEAAGLVPTEPFPEQSNDPRPLIYGMPTWADFFSPRQLLSMLTFLETLREVQAEIRREITKEAKAAAVETYLAMALDKCPNYSSRMSVWHAARTTIANTFNRHDFAFAASHGEFDAAHNLIPWAVGQIVDAYDDLATLSSSAQLPLDDQSDLSLAEKLRIWQGSAADLEHTPSGSVHHICVDPPYYDNVMYAELSDFFYVWLKRSVGHLYPDFFRDTLTNKDDEAVANAARFKGVGVSFPISFPVTFKSGRPGEAKELAKQDYERKMAACFREMARVLHDDGVLTVMFTHKQIEAWDTLASALIGAGFAIKASWPVHTESEHSLHQAQKNAATSTILLVCRKRAGGEGEMAGHPITSAPHPPIPTWWDDIKGRVRETARQKAAEFAEQGIRGVDLYISTFGPVLSIISEHWPVLTSQVDEKTGQPIPLRPETALDLAREEVIALRKRGLLLGRDIQFDAITDWYLMAWDAFKAEQFPADEARKLALALGLDVEADLVRSKRVISKKGSFVVMQKPALRRSHGRADPEALVFDTLLDAVHTAMLIYEEDGAPACAAFLKRTNLMSDGAFKAVVQAMLNAIPRTKLKGDFARPEARVLDAMRLAFFDDLTVPAEEDEGAGGTAEQLGLGLEDGDKADTAEL